MDLKIDQEFASRIPPLTDDEFKQLEANILADGVVINPIVVWNGVIVDGHNRFRIVEKHPHIKYSTAERFFRNRYDALAWICKNQLGRRNLTIQQKKYLIGKQYDSEKEACGGERDMLRDENGQFAADGQNDHLRSENTTAARIARENGIGEKTVRRSAQYSRAVDLADEIEPGIRAEILSGKIKATGKELQSIIEAQPEERDQAVAYLHLTPEEKKLKPIRAGEQLQQISEAMRKPRGKATQADMFCELDDALNGMIFRWNTCLAANSVHLADGSCYAQVQQRVQTGLDYLNQIKNGAMPK